METNWAAENLQTIRTLMERSALYRRALAPIFTFVGVVGIAAALLNWALNLDTFDIFVPFWLIVATIAVAGAFFLVRRQASRQKEPVWSPPTRRVAQAMSPALLSGLGIGIILPRSGFPHLPAPEWTMMCIIIWTFFYGLALHAAGFFVPRGIRLFGWGFLTIGLILWFLFVMNMLPSFNLYPNWLMGLIFGVSHLAYGIYLYFTESQKSAA